MKKDWQTKPYERDRRTDKQKIRDLEDKLRDTLANMQREQAGREHFERVVEQLRPGHKRYEALRNKELVVMDGEAKYLTGEDLDAYCDKLEEQRMKWWLDEEVTAAFGAAVSNHKFLVSKTQFNLVNKLFEEEYRKYRGINTRSKSQETNQASAGHEAGVLRDADGNGVR